MTKMATDAQTELAPELRKRLEQYETEAARLRAEFGDVSEAFSSLMRDMFEPEAIALSVKDGRYIADDDDVSGW